MPQHAIPPVTFALPTKRTWDATKWLITAIRALHIVANKLTSMLATTSAVRVPKEFVQTPNL